VRHTAACLDPKVRHRRTPDGPEAVFIRPDGKHLKSVPEIVAALRHGLANGGRIYEQAFVLRPGQLQLGGGSMQLALPEAHDDEVSDRMRCAVRVRRRVAGRPSQQCGFPQACVIPLNPGQAVSVSCLARRPQLFAGSRPLFESSAQALRLGSGRAGLPVLSVKEEDFQCGAAGQCSTAVIRVVDNTERSFEYGRFFVRQVRGSPTLCVPGTPFAFASRSVVRFTAPAPVLTLCPVLGAGCAGRAARLVCRHPQRSRGRCGALHTVLSIHG
jgi:hypothetical protein